MYSIKKLYQKINGFILFAYILLSTRTVFGQGLGSISDTPMAKGMEKLLKDVSTWLLVIAPLVSVVIIGYCFIRKSICDEMEQRRWNSRIWTTLISCIGVMTASIIVNLLIIYFTEAKPA